MEALMTYGVPGPQGATGATGATGPQGPRGPAGPSGTVSITSFRVEFVANATKTYSLSGAKLVIISGMYCTLVCGRGKSASFFFDGGNGQIQLNSSGTTLTVTKAGYGSGATGYAIS